MTPHQKTPTITLIAVDFMKTTAHDIFQLSNLTGRATPGRRMMKDRMGVMLIKLGLRLLLANIWSHKNKSDTRSKARPYLYRDLSPSQGIRHCCALHIFSFWLEKKKMFSPEKWRIGCVAPVFPQQKQPVNPNPVPICSQLHSGT